MPKSAKNQQNNQIVTKSGNNKGKRQILFEDKVHGHIVDVDSNEEWYTFGFITELYELGVIKDFEYQPASLPLTPKFEYTPATFRDPDKPIKPKFLLHPHVYTADFKFTVFIDTKRNFEYLIQGFKIPKEAVRIDEETGRQVADIWIDVKGGWMQFGGRDFSINQKLVYMLHGIYVNKFVPQDIFRKLGAPHIAMVTPTGRASKVFAGMNFIETVLNSIPD